MFVVVIILVVVVVCVFGFHDCAFLLFINSNFDLCVSSDGNDVEWSVGGDWRFTLVVCFVWFP